MRIPIERIKELSIVLCFVLMLTLVWHKPLSHRPG
jgi:hypothetical protein